MYEICVDYQSSICLNESVTLSSNMTTPKKKSRKRKPKINEEQLEKHNESLV